MVLPQLLKLLVREYLYTKEWLRIPVVDYANLCARFVFACPTLVILYQQIERAENRNPMALFEIKDMPYFTDDGKHHRKNLKFNIDLVKQTVDSATFGNEKIAACDLYMLLWWYSQTVHIQTHALANWGCDNESKDSFVKRMSVITTVYNFFGYVGSPQFFENLCQVGWFRGTQFHTDGGVADAFLAVVDHHLQQKMTCHKHILELMPYSELVRYIVAVRNIFLNEFDKFELGDIIDGEAMFAGTVLHSLDHEHVTMVLGCGRAELLIKSASAATRNMSCMVEIGRVVSACLTSPHVPEDLFAYKFRDATHPFFASVYQRAARVNRTMADRMDCCIIK
jgi:hypothetical protein